VIRYTAMPARAQRPVDALPFHVYRFDDGTIWTEFYRAGRDYLLRFPGLADFELSADGTAAMSYPAEGGDAATVEHLYLNQVVPLALSRQGRPAFHASVITVAGGAAAFLGGTGMGKSTLAASFALSDAAFLTDDALLVEERGGACEVLPSHPSLRLWEDSVEALAGGGRLAASRVSYSTKARLLAGDGLAHSATAQALLAAFVLEDTGTADVTTRALTGSERHMAWVRNSFLLDVEDRELLARHFDWTHRIAAAVPTFALDYPRDYGMLPAVRDAVRHRIAGLED